jgi:hypothetical protein
VLELGPRLGYLSFSVCARWTSRLEESTVKMHVTRVLSKLDGRDRLQAVIFAYESRLGRRGRADR